MLDVLPLAFESGSTIWHLPISLSSPNYHQPSFLSSKSKYQRTLLTKIRFPTLTEFTFLTFGSVKWDNVISDFDVRYSLTD